MKKVFSLINFKSLKGNSAEACANEIIQQFSNQHERYRFNYYLFNFLSENHALTCLRLSLPYLIRFLDMLNYFIKHFISTQYEDRFNGTNGELGVT